MVRKRVLILTRRSASNVSEVTAASLRAALPEVEVALATLDQLVMVLDGARTRIYEPYQEFDVANFDLVIFRAIAGSEQLAIAVATYCRKRHIRYIDPYIWHLGDGKLAGAFRQWERDLPVPRTMYGPHDQLLVLAKRGLFGWPLVVKGDNSQRGRDNFLVKTPTAMRRILQQYADKPMVVQHYIPNDGDYRILVLNNEPSLVMLRKAARGSHLNNTSQGGTAEVVALDTLPQRVRSLAVRAAKLEQLVVAGVDIVVDAHTHKPVILEVNRAPQIASGKHVTAKLAAYVTMVQALLGQVQEQKA